jgi:hypothetical protein
MRNWDTFPKSLLAFVLLIVWLPLVSGCAAKTLPPSEPTVTLLQEAYKEMRVLVDSGQTPPIEARDHFYQKLVEVDPPLPALDQLLDDRRQIRAELMAGGISPGEADRRLKQRESELLDRWEEMAAEYASEQRRLERQQREYERAYRQERRIEEGSGIRNLPRP